MHFFNSYLLRYAGIVLISTIAIYFLSLYLDGQQGMAGGLLSLAYLAVVVLSAVLISRRDPHQGFFGFNYHLITYLICLAVPLVLRAAGYLPEVSYVGSMALIWGIGVLVHLLIFLILFRNRRIKSYDKQDLFQ